MTTSMKKGWRYGFAGMDSINSMNRLSSTTGDEIDKSMRKIL